MFRKPLCTWLIFACICSSIGPIPKVHADEFLGLPQPGVMVSLSSAYEPAMIKGITIHKDSPFMFDFIVDVGQDRLSGQALKDEGNKLIKYFLASLAIPEKDLWVNLSPYEKDRTIPEALGQTDMGRDLLAQDYILKQLTASLIYPEKELGKKFWDKVYAQAQAKFGAVNVPVNTFNKVWIMADRAEVFERNNTAFVTSSHLKAMLEEDYLALQKHSVSTPTTSTNAQIIREIILPEIEKEVNTGKHFANLRQIFNSLILANWYKKSLKAAVLNQVYSDKEKVQGINLEDATIKEQIYNRYLQAYKKGVFNFVKEEQVQGQTTLKKYFSGGLKAGAAANPAVTNDQAALAQSLPTDRALVSFETGLNPAKGALPDAAMRAELEQTAVGRYMLARPSKSLTVDRSDWYDFDNMFFYNPKEKNWYIRLNILRLDDGYDLGERDGYVISWDGVKGELIFRVDDPSAGGILYTGVSVRLKQDPFINMTIREGNGGPRERVLSGASITLTDEAVNLLRKARITSNTGGVDPYYRASLKRGLRKIKTVGEAGSARTSKALVAARMEYQSILGSEHKDQKMLYGARWELVRAVAALGYKNEKRVADLFFKSANQGPEELQMTLNWFRLAVDAPGQFRSLKFMYISQKNVEFFFGLLGGKRIDDPKEYSLDEVETAIRSLLKEGLRVEWDGLFFYDRRSSIFGRLQVVILGIFSEAVYAGRHKFRLLEYSPQPRAPWAYSPNWRANERIIKTVNLNKLATEIRQWLEGQLRIIEQMKLGAEHPDAAMLSLHGDAISEDRAALANPGGIDLNASGMDMKVHKDGKGVEMNFDPVMIERFKREGIEGLAPVIFRITPVVSIWPLLGMEPLRQPEKPLAAV